MPSRSERKQKRVRPLPLILFILILAVFAYFAYSYFEPSRTTEVKDPRWTEDNVGIDIVAEERAVLEQLPGFKQSRFLAEAEEKKQQAREDAIRKEEQDKAAQAQKEAEEAAAKEAEAKALAEAEAQQEAEQASQADTLDPAIVDYDIAMSYLFSELDSQISFLGMLLDDANNDPSYMESMDFAVGFEEGYFAIYDIYERMNMITPPPSLSDAHGLTVDATWMLYEGALKISTGSNEMNYDVMDQGALDWGMAINMYLRANQQVRDVTGG